MIEIVLSCECQVATPTRPWVFFEHHIAVTQVAKFTTYRRITRLYDFSVRLMDAITIADAVTCHSPQTPCCPQLTT
jgi:hypothetical protein